MVVDYNTAVNFARYIVGNKKCEKVSIVNNRKKAGHIPMIYCCKTAFLWSAVLPVHSCQNSYFYYQK